MATLNSLKHTHVHRHSMFSKTHRQKYTQISWDNGDGAPGVILGLGLNWEKEERKERRGKGLEGGVSRTTSDEK